jgi:hypothetical protein
MVSGIMTIAGVIGITNQNMEARPEVKRNTVTVDYSAKLQIMDPVPDIFDELIGKKIPSFTYMLYVATCETEQNWQNSGQYAGGFGFMHKSNKVHKDYAAVQSTWLHWGGAEFAKIPQRATSKEQALVWIRTYATGWTRPNGVFKPPVRGVPRSNCHDDLKVGWHVYDGAEWPVPDTWVKGDPQIKPWNK